MFVPKVPNDKILQSFTGEGFFRNPLAEKILEPCAFTRTIAPIQCFDPILEFAKQLFLNSVPFRFPAREKYPVPVVFWDNI